MPWPEPNTIPTLLAAAWLLPLAGFAVEIFAGYWQKSRTEKTAAGLAIACIGGGFLCSLLALLTWGHHTGWAALKGDESHAAGHGDDHGKGHQGKSHDDHGSKDGHDKGAEHKEGNHEPADPKHAEEPAVAAVPGDLPADLSKSKTEPPQIEGPLTGRFYTLARFGSLQVSIDYYVDSLTLVMFTMVTFIATCIHVFATGYMAEELTDDYVDHQVHTRSGGHFHRPGRFYRFFAFMSLFCFSMLGLVIAGNIFMVFVFWELVGVCSYLLIGFYVERKSASTAANKAFIMNRVGDFGFLIGLMVIWTYFGTFSFGPYEMDGQVRPGVFEMVRGDGELIVDHENKLVHLQDGHGHWLVDSQTGEPRTIPYMLLVVAGLGIFAGCIGKSAQFPLQTWLPDAMEGPTPVSALVHSATMVAAGVYLAGRFFPVFTHEVLLAIAYVGCITLFLAATIAIVATDIKRVLAYSTISQLGYMMLGIGVAGWGAGLFHLITHAFFKSLMFLASGSVIAGCHHEQEMPKMGGLRKKMPITAYTMLVGVIAIAGLAIPGTPIAFSGYHSKDAIVASALAFANANPTHFLLFLVPLVTAGITAFYMFRLWFYTFAGQPRDQHLHDHVHESPSVMTGPLVVLAVLAALCAVGGESGPLYKLLAHSEPASLHEASVGAETALTTLPGHEAVHAVHSAAGRYALIAAVAGTVLAYLLYGRRIVDPADIKRQLASLHTFLVEKWRFDDLYDAAFVRPVHVVSSWFTWVDRVIIDGVLHRVSRITLDVSKWDRKFDEGAVDGLVNLVGNAIFGVGSSFRAVQTGRLRQYIMFIAVGVLGLFLLMFAFFPR